ncbi:hypothetical protein ACFW1A_16550 [Kitasatospora sp. NPDC058965]|uniref:hypothetical protein n=1 Tax=Kitasatospora sp. NPDC058965 TaxID=3346682 RepID=UPI003680562C
MGGRPNGSGSGGERARRIWEVAVPVALGVVLALLDAFGVMSSSYAAAAVLGVLGLIGYGQIGRDRQAAEQLADLKMQLGGELAAVRQAVDGVSELRFYSHHERFYEALAEQVGQAKEEVLTSYLRRYPPDALNSAAVAAYFTACADWVAASPLHQLRRVVTSENAPGMADWTDSQRQLVLDHRARYLVRVVDVQGDAMSVAIIDRDHVFFAFGADPYVVTGFSLRSAKLGEYMRSYHQALWEKGRDLTATGRP